MGDEVVTEGSAGSGIWRTVLDRPEAFLVLALCGVLVVASVAALGGWLSGWAELRIPLLLAGLSVIALGIATNKGAAGVALAILIIGILVAPRDYLLRIAHMITRPDAPFGEYAKKYEGEGATNIQTTTEDIVSRVLKTLKGRGLEVPREVQKELGTIVSDEVVQAIRRRVLSENASFPLGEVVAGKSQQLYSNHGTANYLMQDMEFLRAEGLITYPGSLIQEAVPTDLGRRVAGGLARSIPTFIDSTEAFDQNRPDPASMPALAVQGGPKSHEFAERNAVSWFRLKVEAEANYTIKVKSDEGDPLIRLYGPDEFVFVVEDDDGAENLNSLIERKLSPGVYYLGIQNLFDDTASFTVEVTRDPE